MSKTLREVERKQDRLVEKAERALADARHLRKHGPRSGDLGQSFERQMDVIAKRVETTKQDREALRALHRHYEGG